MPDLVDGEVAYVQGSAATPYTLKNAGGVYSCSCPAWRNAGGPIDRRTCKHLKAFRGDAAEAARLGQPSNATTTPSNPPTNAAATNATATNAGTSVTPPPVLLAHAWDNALDLSGYWMSEKLDGVRAYWDGSRFVSRLGNTFFAPAWFTRALPKHPLDGELWMGRKRFQETVSVVRQHDAGQQWQALRYLVFDAPHLTTPFEARVAFVDALVRATGAANVEAVTHERVKDTAHLIAELRRIEALGGEGLMVRRPGSLYEAKRSTSLYKVKTFHDAEAKVIGHEPGKGKHKGRVGALVLEMANGTRFNVGTGLSDAERQAPPAVGALVTYRYQELSKDGVPRFPSYVGIAIDKSGPS